VLISERLWIMSLDDRGLPRVTGAQVCVTAGLMLDLRSAGLIEWTGDRIRRTAEVAPEGLLGWAANRLDEVREPTLARFVIDALYPGAWEHVGMSLVDQGMARMTRHGLRRKSRFSFTTTPLRREIVDASRALLFDDAATHDDDAVLAVLGAAGIGDELLSRSPFTDESVAVAFADREPGSLQRQVDEAISFALVPFYANGYYSTGANPG